MNMINSDMTSPARKWPTTSARLPFLTLVMKAPSLPVSVIFPPTTYSHHSTPQHSTWQNISYICYTPCN